MRVIGVVGAVAVMPVAVAVMPVAVAGEMAEVAEAIVLSRGCKR